MDDKLDCALDLIRRIQPQLVEKILSKVVDSVPDLCADPLSFVHQPLKAVRDDGVGKEIHSLRHEKNCKTRQKKTWF